MDLSFNNIMSDDIIKCQMVKEFSSDKLSDVAPILFWEHWYYEQLSLTIIMYIVFKNLKWDYFYLDIFFLQTLMKSTVALHPRNFGISKPSTVSKATATELDNVCTASETFIFCCWNSRWFLFSLFANLSPSSSWVEFRSFT